MSDIFISYASEDRPRAEMIAGVLEDRGWSIFWDRTIPIGKTWRETIGRELDAARCVIVLWSKTSIESGWVQEEADDAKRRGILVPILIEHVSPPIGFRSIQAADLVDWDATQPTHAFRRLIADISVLIGLPPKESEQDRKATALEIGLGAKDEHQRPGESVDRRASEERKPATKEAKLDGGEARLKPAEEPEAKHDTEIRQEKDGHPSAEPRPHERDDRVGRRRWALAAGGAIILIAAGVIAYQVAAPPPRLPAGTRPAASPDDRPTADEIARRAAAARAEEDARRKAEEDRRSAAAARAEEDARRKAEEDRRAAAAKAEQDALRKAQEDARRAAAAKAGEDSGRAAAAGDALRARFGLTSADAKRLAERVTSLRGAMNEAASADSKEVNPQDLATLQSLMAAKALPIADARDLAGTWKCRTIKVGSSPPLVIYSYFDCRIIGAGDRATFEKITGSQRNAGDLMRLDASSFVFRGVGYTDFSQRKPYGSGPESDEVGLLFRIGADRLRIEFPAPYYESHYDLLELVRKR